MNIVREVEDQLKNCPCCGSSDIAMMKKDAVDRMEIGGKGARFHIRCQYCNIQTSDGHMSKQNAIETWNLRNNSQKEIERCTKK